MVHALTMKLWCWGRQPRGWLALVPGVALLLALAGCEPAAPVGAAEAAAAAPEEANGVTLEPEQIKDLGIGTVAARATTYRHGVAGYGSVVALEMVAQADAEIEAAAAVAQQSKAAAARARSLATGEEAAVSQEVVEAAQSKAAADAVALSLAERKLQSVFGLNVPWKTAAERQAVMKQLANGQAVLVRLTFPLGALGGEPFEEIAVARLGNAAPSWSCHNFWEAPADPSLPGGAYYCLLEGSNLMQNERLIGTVRVGEETSGVWIPQAAVLVGENALWVYVEDEPGHFVRVLIDANKPDGEGFFLDDSVGVAADENVVVKAAGLLLARELNPATEAEE
jgi:hypothetical protein